MAENPIRKEDIIDGAGIAQVLKEVTALLIELNKAFTDVIATTKQWRSEVANANAATKEGQAIISERAAGVKELDRESIKISATIKELEKAERNLIKSQREEQDVSKTAEGSYKRLSLEMRKLTAQWKEGDATTRSKLTPSIAKLDKELKKLDATIGKNQRNVGNYSSAFKGMGKSLLMAGGLAGGATVAFSALFRVIKGAFKTTFEFEAAMSQVKAISGATAIEFTNLRDSAMALGATSKYTAIQVAGLQTEYAKLGFSAAEIMKITEATIQLATATGEDLAASANVAGSTMRAFGLDASKMQMIVDVMAESFNKSALDLQSFQIAMQQIGPVANAVNISLQRSTAQLSVLSNAGLDASISGTSLRNIYIELEKQGLTWDEAMAKINGTTNKATMALSLFGKRGAVAAIILADNMKAADDFTDSYDNAAGAAEKMATIMQDNVVGSAKILKSAWEGLILRTNESSGAVKGFLDMLSNLVTAINSKGRPAIDSLFDERKIDSFGAKWKFFADQGIGFSKTFTASIIKSKKRTQEFADMLFQAGEKDKKIQDEKDAIVARAKAEEDRINAEKIATIEAQVAAEEEQEKRQKELAKVIQKGEAERAANMVKHVEDATKDNEMITVHIGMKKDEATQLAEMDKQQVASEEDKQKKMTELAEKGAIDRNAAQKTALQNDLEVIAAGIDAVADIFMAQKQRELNAAGDNAKKREEIERKYFKKEQALAIAQAVVNGALAITKAQAQTGVLSPFVIPMIIVTTLAQIALIASQKFAKGGFTGKGNKRDETGEKIAGIVHEEEFVINKKQTRKYRPLLEAIHKDDALAIASSLNNTNLVWDKTAQLINQQDPYTEKMFNLMKETPVSYTDSKGNTVLKYADGRKRIIKRPVFRMQPSMMR